ncbi:MAG: hypothetical protein JSR80_01720 [Verrucomicrobia bacterium]|nr:hypothetical protein [Verrucomicrobiota bacterium]
MTRKSFKFYLFLGALLPLMGALFFYGQKVSDCSRAKEEVRAVADVLRLQQKRQHLNLCARATFTGADHFYIDNQLETLTLLNREEEEIKSLLAAEKSLPDKAILERLKVLGKNRLHFSEGSVQTFGEVTETLEELVGTVEVNEEDLMRLLTHVEGVSWRGEAPPEKRPQLLITDLHFDRKERGGSEVFELRLKFLKREFS